MLLNLLLDWWLISYINKNMILYFIIYVYTIIINYKNINKLLIIIIGYDHKWY